METVKIDLFFIDELDGKARERALDAMRDDGWGDYLGGDDALASLKAFAQHFDARLSHWSISWENASYSSATFELPNWWESADPDDSNDIAERDERLAVTMAELKCDGSCQHTGYCADDDANEGALKAYADGVRDLGYILQAGFRRWLEVAQAACEYANSDEVLIESARANELQFTKYGTRWRF